jgi:hypothetical protein
MTTKKEFAMTVAEVINSKLGGVAEATIQEVQKANDITLVGLTIREPDNMIAPNIYVEGAYDKYVDGDISIDEAAEELLKIYEENKAADVNIERLFDFDNLLANARVKLISMSANAEYLKDKVFRVVADLAEVLYTVVDMGNTDGSEASVTLTTGHLRSLDDAQIDKLFSAAEKNINVSVKSMAQAFSGTMPGEFGDASETPTLDQEPFLILQGASVNGANALASKDAMEKAAAIAGRNDFYIIPSSIHEVLLINPDSMSVNDLKNMCTEVNNTQVAPEEVLSYNIYRYDFEGDGLKIAA